MEIAGQIAHGLALQREGQQQEAIDFFIKLAERFPEDAEVLFETGGVFDSNGYEEEAIRYYYKAIAIGLKDELLVQAMVQLGSSLRNARMYDEAVQLLQTARARFPDHRALAAFYALALHSSGRHAEALAEMIDLTLRVPDLYERYTRSLTNYAQDLRDSESNPSPQ